MGDPIAGKVKDTHKSHRRLNLLISQQKIDAEKNLMDMESRQQSFTIEQVTKKIKRKSKAVSFTDFANDYLDKVYKEGRINRSIRTIGQVCSSIHTCQPV